MDAKMVRLAVVLFVSLFVSASARAAEWSTDNFVVTADTEELARKVAHTAEGWRVRLAREWLGYELPKWSRKCPILVQVGQIGAGGETTFRFSWNAGTKQTEVYDWRMRVQGTEERILDSVVPHEVSHTVFASHFRRPLPRWADEGAATLAEHESEQRRQDLTLKQVWNGGRFPLKTLLGMTEYPREMRQVMTLYAQGYSLADYLVQKGGRARFLQLLAMAEESSWDAAFQKLYGIDDIGRLESTWGEWVLAGSPPLTPDTMLASNDAQERGAEGDSAVIRGQTPDSGMKKSTGAGANATGAAKTTFGGFLAPRTAEVGTVVKDTPVVVAEAEDPGREPRPEPLGLEMEEELGGVERGAIETSHQNGDGQRSPLAQRARLGQPRLSQERDFFSSDASERPRRRSSEWGGLGFPSPRD